MHRGNTGEHIDYNEFVSNLIGKIAEDYRDDVDLGMSQEDASYYAARRIFNLQSTLRNALVSSEEEGLNLFLHFDDPALEDQYNKWAVGNNSPR